MAPGDRVSDIQRTQIQLEELTDPGTAVTPVNNILLSSMEYIPAGDWETRQNKSGSKAARTQTLTKDKSTGKFQTKDGATPTYGELGLLLAGVLVGDDGTNTGVDLAATNPGTGAARDWTFFIKPEEKDTRRTFTIQRGDDGMAYETSGVSLQDFTLEFTQDSITINANALGNRLRSTADNLTPAITFDSGLPTITDNQITVEPGSICVYMSRTSRADLVTQAASPANALRMVKRGKWSVKGRSELWDPVRCDGTNYAVEGLEADCMIKAEADPVVMALVQHLRNNSAVGDPSRVWVRIEATGPVIETGTPDIPYRLTIDSCFFVSGISEVGPETKLEAAEFSFVFAHDPVFDGGTNPGICEAVLTNKQTALLA
jgi:hypothetical protein